MSRRIVAYLPAHATKTRHLDILSLPGNKITHLVYCFANFVQQGSNWVVGWPDHTQDQPPIHKNTNIWKLIQLKRRWPNLRVLLSVGGGNRSHQGEGKTTTPTPIFSQIAATEPARQVFVKSCIDQYILPGHPGLGRLFDGIDIDWEFPSAPDIHNLTLLLQEFRLQLDQAAFQDERQLDLSFAARMSPAELELGALNETVDWVNLMAYIAHAPNLSKVNKKTDFNSPLHCSSDEPQANITFNIDDIISGAHGFLQTGFPAQRLVLGVNAYGRSYAGVPDINNGLYQTYTGPGPGSFKAAGILTYQDMATNYLPTYRNLWDPKTQSAYLYNAAQKIWISYDNETSVTAKRQYTESKDLGGLMLWDLSADLVSTASSSSTPPSLIDAMWYRTTISKLVHRVIWSEKTNAAPAMASHSGRLFVALKDASSNRLAVATAGGDGLAFPGTLVSHDSSDLGPTLVSHNRGSVKSPPQFALHIGWKDLGNSNVNCASVKMLHDGSNNGTFTKIQEVSKPVVLPNITSTARPALASIHGALFIAWRGADNNEINIMYSHDDGKTFVDKHVLASSAVDPALALHNGDLHIAWTATGSGSLSVAQVGLSMSASGKVEGVSGLIGATTVLPETSGAAPALCSHNGLLFLAWTATGSGGGIYATMSYDNGATFALKTALSETSDVAPALCSHDGILFLAWKGAATDQLNLAQLQLRYA
jgi:GH18 family chitinase